MFNSAGKNLKASTFQLQLGKNIANKKTPKRGPLVAEVMSCELSITPDMKATPNAIPMVMAPRTMLRTLMPNNCCLSDKPDKHGNFDTKSSHATVDIELKLDTAKLKADKFINGNENGVAVRVV